MICFKRQQLNVIATETKKNQSINQSKKNHQVSAIDNCLFFLSSLFSLLRFFFFFWLYLKKNSFIDHLSIQFVCLFVWLVVWKPQHQIIVRLPINFFFQFYKIQWWSDFVCFVLIFIWLIVMMIIFTFN